MPRKTLERQILKEMKINNELLSSISKKEDQILELEREEDKREKGKWAWSRRNIGTIVSIFSLFIAIVALMFVTQTQIHEESLLKIQQIGVIDSVLWELKNNSELMYKYQDDPDQFFIEKDGELEAGLNIIQTHLSIDNLTELIKNPQYNRTSKPEFYRNLVSIKTLTSQANIKIYDIRMNSLFWPQEATAQSQKNTLELFAQLQPLIENARNDLKKQRGQLVEELNLLLKLQPT